MKRPILILILLVLAAGSSFGAQPDILAKARGYLGTDSVLDSVKSIHYVGSITTVASDQPGKKIQSTLDVIFEKPFKARTVSRNGDSLSVAGLDDLEGWERIQNANDPKQYRQRWSDASSVYMVRGTVWQNLYFYRPIPGQYIDIVDKGRDAIDGTVTERVDFDHGQGVKFSRYFDVETGRLVLTETPTETIREVGDMTISGIHFPKVVVSVAKGNPTHVLMTTVTFVSVTVNEAFPDSLFDAPNADTPLTDLPKSTATVP